jgi:enoyl-CoA hydratase/carnithine racemase
MASPLGSEFDKLPALLRESLEAAEMLMLDLAVQVVELEASDDELQCARQLLAEQRAVAARIVSEQEGGEVFTFSAARVPAAAIGH